MTLEGYLRHRRVFEVGMWVAAGLVNFIANSVVVTLDLGKLGVEAAPSAPRV